MAEPMSGNVACIMSASWVARAAPLFVSHAYFFFFYRIAGTERVNVRTRGSAAARVRVCVVCVCVRRVCGTILLKN